MPPPPAPNVDARLTEIQTSLTELLERLDVLNDRITRLEQGGQAPQPIQAPAPAPRRTGEAPALHPSSQSLAGARLAETYRSALMLYGKGKFDEARKAFQQVFDSDPAGDLADNALYWIGETYYSAGDYPSALRYDERVVKDFAEQNKAPDALFKIALIQEKTGDLVLARTTLEEVINRYPFSTAAAAAKAELKRIRY